MRYFYAFVLIVVSVGSILLTGDGTVAVLTGITILTLIFDKKDWTKGPY